MGRLEPFDPAGRYALQNFYAEPYGQAPIPLDAVTRYALSSQRSVVPMVEDVMATAD
jgi:hypothetical protein